MGGTDLMKAEYTTITGKLSKSFVDFIADFMDDNGIDGYCGWLEKGDMDFKEALEEHIANHPEDIRHAEALLQSIDASDMGIEVRLFDY